MNLCLCVCLPVCGVHKVNIGNVHAGRRLGVSLGHAPPQGLPDEPRVKKRTSIASSLWEFLSLSLELE